MGSLVDNDNAACWVNSGCGINTKCELPLYTHLNRAWTTQGSKDIGSSTLLPIQPSTRQHSDILTLLIRIPTHPQPTFSKTSHLTRPRKEDKMVCPTDKIVHAANFPTKEDLSAHARREILQEKDRNLVYKGVDDSWAHYVLDSLDRDGEVESKRARYVYTLFTSFIEEWE